MSNYRNSLEKEKKQIEKQIEQLLDDLKKHPSRFNETYDKINSLRANLQAKKDRIEFMNKPMPYLMDIQTIPSKR